MNPRRSPRKKLSTPGKSAGLEFEAVQGQINSSDATFSYEEVSDLVTVTPAVKRRAKSTSTDNITATKAFPSGSPSRARSKSVVEKLGNGRLSEGVRAEHVTNRDGPVAVGEATRELGGAAKRRRQRQRQPTAEPATAIAPPTRAAGAENVAPMATRPPSVSDTPASSGAAGICRKGGDASRASTEQGSGAELHASLLPASAAGGGSETETDAERTESEADLSERRGDVDGLGVADIAVVEAEVRAPQMRAGGRGKRKNGIQDGDGEGLVGREKRKRHAETVQACSTAPGAVAKRVRSAKEDRQPDAAGEKAAGDGATANKGFPPREAAAVGAARLSLSARGTGESGLVIAAVAATQRTNRSGKAPAKRPKKMPRYPSIPFTPSCKASTFKEALEEAITAEVKGLLRERGQDSKCRSMVRACAEVGKELSRQSGDIASDMDVMPKLDLEFVRSILEEERALLATYKEEERLWAVEEKRLLAIEEANERIEGDEAARGDLQSTEELFSGGDLSQHSLSGSASGLRGDEADDASSEHSEGIGTAQRTSDLLLAATEDMILKAGAIGRGLREMGAGVAEAQETKDVLVREFRKRTLRNYPNVDNPKAGIAAMLT